MSSVERSTDIAADADQISTSQSATNSQLESAVGLGTTSGRAVIAVGEFALRGIELINISVTLQRVASRLRAGRATGKDVEILLELQRIGLYPNFIRRKTWSLLYMLFDYMQVDDVIRVLREWPQMELELFLRQLMVYRSGEWPMISKYQSSPERPGNEECVTHSVCRIMLSLLEWDPTVIHGVASLPKFSRLLVGSRITLVGSSKWGVSHSLPGFLDVWVSHLAEGYHDDQDIPLVGRCMITYLASSPPGQVQYAISHILSTLRPFAYLPDSQADDPHIDINIRVESVLDLYPSLQRLGDRFPHPTFPFLHFLYLLCEESGDAIGASLDMDLPELLMRLHDIGYYHQPEPSGEQTHTMDATCQSIMALLLPEKSLAPRERHPSQYTYPSRSASCPPSSITTTTAQKRSSADSLSSLRAVFRLAMPPPPPPPSPTLPRAPPPSPRTPSGRLSLSSGETPTSFNRDFPQEPPPRRAKHLTGKALPPIPSRTRHSSTITSAAISTNETDARTDCATVGVDTLTSYLLSRPSTAYSSRRSHRLFPSQHPPSEDSYPRDLTSLAELESVALAPSVPLRHPIDKSNRNESFEDGILAPNQLRTSFGSDSSVDTNSLENSEKWHRDSPQPEFLDSESYYEFDSVADFPVREQKVSRAKSLLRKLAGTFRMSNHRSNTCQC